MTDGHHRPVRRQRTGTPARHRPPSRPQRARGTRPRPARRVMLSGLALLVIVFWALRRELPTAPAGPLLPAEPPPQLASFYTGIGTVGGLVPFSTFITVRLERLGPGAGVRLTLIEQAGGAGGSTATYAGTIQGATVQAGVID